jgi:hypothetical protein
MLESQLEMLEVMEIEDFKSTESRRAGDGPQRQIKREAPPKHAGPPERASNNVHDESKPRVVPQQRPPHSDAGPDLSRPKQPFSNPKDSQQRKDI